jgi:putative Holliday junction resolvase
MQNGRRIAFDFGDVRIGVAVSDLSGLLATPLENIPNIESTLMATLEALLLEYQPIYLVVGSPLHLSGQASAKGESVKIFLQSLSSITKAPIYLVDERLTSVSAARSIKETGKNTREAKSLIDGFAAAQILESALNQERLQGSPMNRYS